MEARMELWQIIAQQKDNDVIFIGAEDGSSYLFIGTKEEYENDIDKISSDYFNRLVSQIDTLNRARTDFRESAEGIAKILRKAKGRDLELSEIKQIKILTHNISQNGRTITQIVVREKAIKEQIDNWITFKHRPANPPYKRLQGDGKVVLMKGTEHGKYWFREDYLKRDKTKPLFVDDIDNDSESESEDDT